jgi:amino acid transporter
MALDGTHKVLHYSFTGDAPAHPSGWSVIAPHGFNSVMLQATIAIFLLCGFESITSLGEEAKNPKKDIARGVLLSLLIQGLFCYMLEYFAANYFLSSTYSMADAKGSAAPIGDTMVIIGNTLLGAMGRHSWS